MKLAAVIGLFIALMGVRPYESRAQTHAPPSDFAFRFEFGLCTTDVMDTFENTFTRDVNSDQYPATSVSLVLPAATIQAIYDALVNARFFEYPSEFHVESSSVVVPSSHYRLEVRSGGAKHTVSWRDDSGTSTAQKDQLRSLFKKIASLIHARPEVQRFFTSIVVCA